jgi:hypothetical protein
VGGGSELVEVKKTEAGNFERARFKGKEIAPRYRRTTVWVKRDGRWQCVSFHASRMAEVPRPSS